MFTRELLLSALLLGLVAAGGAGLGDNRGLAGLAASWVRALPPAAPAQLPGPRRYPPGYRGAPPVPPA